MDLLRSIFKGNKVIWIIFLALCLISIIEVFSAASTLTYKSGDHWGPITQHTILLSIGALIVVLVHNIPYKWFQMFPYPLLLVSVVLLAFVMITGFVTGDRINGAARWMTFMGIQFQPSELAKMGVIMGTAVILSRGQDEHGASPKAFKRIMIMTCIVCGLILPENYSTGVLLFGTVFLMMIIGRTPLKQLGKLSLFVIIVAGVFVTFLMATPDSTLDNIPGGHRFTTWKARIIDHRDDNTKNISPEELDVNENLQTNHANIAIATSHLIGKGPGNSKERDFLPQAYSDFIFAIILEELGLLGGFFVIFLYIILLIRTSKIANKCDKDFPAMLAIGVSLLIVSQALLNMLVAVGLFPVTGQPLPLISRGGTSTLINCVYIGVILSVSRYNNLQAEKQKAIEEGNIQKIEQLEEINKGLEKEIQA